MTKRIEQIDRNASLASVYRKPPLNFRSSAKTLILRRLHRCLSTGIADKRLRTRTDTRGTSVLTSIRLTVLAHISGGLPTAANQLMPLTDNRNIDTGLALRSQQ